MKKTLPVLIGVIAGLIVVAERYVTVGAVTATREELLTITQILAAAAYVMGAINLVQVNVPKIRRREPDWGYKLILFGGAVAMFGVGLKWQNIGDDPSPGVVEVARGEIAGATTARLEVRAADPSAAVRIDGGAPRPAMPGGQPLVVELPPGSHQIQVAMPSPVTGYGELDQTVELAAGDVARARADLPLLWGPQGRLRTWIYNYIFAPCNATMFALLAFYIASAGFRAFRARNTEAALLLGAAVIVLLGRAPIGRAISDALPAMTEWLVDVPNNAGRRAIIMGAALGGIVTGLRVILGLERSHLGSE
jgi:hypothetical protein